MRCTPIVTGHVLSFATVSTQAQVSIDVSKITCDEYVHDKIPTSDFISCRVVVVGGALDALALANRQLVKWLLSCHTQQLDY
jgi:hypothetical protein